MEVLLSSTRLVFREPGSIPRLRSPLLVKNKFPLVIYSLPTLWYFVVADQMDSDSKALFRIRPTMKRNRVITNYTTHPVRS